jgi:two-component system LytT family sensor kinase
VTLADEIEHVNAYLQIEKARFQANLQIQMLVPEALAHHQLPAFTLQPIVENAIKHGTSQHLGVAKSPSAPASTSAGCSWILKIMPGCIRTNPAPAGWE